jgi:hypothetical protein
VFYNAAADSAGMARTKRQKSAITHNISFTVLRNYSASSLTNQTLSLDEVLVFKYDLPSMTTAAGSPSMIKRNHIAKRQRF